MFDGNIISESAENTREIVHNVVVDRSRDALLTDFGKATLLDRYLLPGESFQDLFARVASYYADDVEHAQRLYDYISRLWFMPSTPVLSNGGTSRGLPISCFLNEANDSLDGIVNLWNENVWLAAKGGGIGSYWGNLRSIGENVKGNGKTSGIIPFVKVMDSMTLAISQGSLRRGSAATYLPISHPEIEEFIEMRRPTGGDPNRKALNLHHGVVITDEFMRAVENDAEWRLLSPHTGNVVRRVKARDLWIRMLLARLETGEPYMLFIDHVNKAIPEHHKNLGLKVKTSNLCVAPETFILTKEGQVEISTKEDQVVEVWNGFEWSEVTVRKTGTNQKLLRVTLSNGATLDCTPEHKWYTIKGYYRKTFNEVRTKDLKPGDKLRKFDLPTDVRTSGIQMDHSYLRGFFAAEGTFTARMKPLLHVYGEKKNLIPRLNANSNLSGSFVEQENGRMSFILKNVNITPEDKYRIPFEWDLNSRLEWFAGLIDGDGTRTNNQGNQSIQLASVDPDFLESIRLLLQELGVNSKVTLMHQAKERLMPNGKNPPKLFKCQDCYRLLIPQTGINRLLDLGLKTSRLELNYFEPQRQAAEFVKVVSVEDLGRVSDTFCFTEPKRHLGVFNGILTGQCSEITLPTGIDHLGKQRTAVCCLSSLNLEYFKDWVSHPTFIEDTMRFLDNVLDDFIKKAPPEMANAVYAAMRERSIGLGVMGFHSFLQNNMVSIESEEAYRWNRVIFSHIKNHANAASKKLAEIKGPCPDSVDGGTFERFSNKIAIAPTASISIIAGGASPGIEPVAANVYTHKTLSGSFSVRSPALAKVLDKYGQNNEEIWSSIALNSGSVSHLNFLTQEEKDVFKTAIEIDQLHLIALAGERTPYICQAQSLNVFIPADVSKKELHKLHLAAWKLGVKSLYYCRSMSLKRAESENDVKDSELAKRTKALAAQEANKYEECLACQ